MDDTTVEVGQLLLESHPAYGRAAMLVDRKVIEGVIGLIASVPECDDPQIPPFADPPAHHQRSGSNDDQ